MKSATYCAHFVTFFLTFRISVASLGREILRIHISAQPQRLLWTSIYGFENISSVRIYVGYF